MLPKVMDFCSLTLPHKNIIDHYQVVVSMIF